MLKQDLQKKYEQTVRNLGLFTDEKMKLERLNKDLHKDLERAKDQLSANEQTLQIHQDREISCRRFIHDMEVEINMNKGGPIFDEYGNQKGDSPEKETDHKEFLFKLLGFMKSATYLLEPVRPNPKGELYGLGRDSSSY